MTQPKSIAPLTHLGGTGAAYAAGTCLQRAQPALPTPCPVPGGPRRSGHRDGGEPGAGEGKQTGSGLQDVWEGEEEPAPPAREQPLATLPHPPKITGSLGPSAPTRCPPRRRRVPRPEVPPGGPAGSGRAAPHSSGQPGGAGRVTRPSPHPGDGAVILPPLPPPGGPASRPPAPPPHAQGAGAGAAPLRPAERRRR